MHNMFAPRARWSVKCDGEKRDSFLVCPASAVVCLCKVFRKQELLSLPRERGGLSYDELTRFSDAGFASRVRLSVGSKRIKVAPQSYPAL